MIIGYQVSENDHVIPPAYCIDDPSPPLKGVRGKAVVKIHEDINHNILIAKKLMLKSVGSLDHPIAKWTLAEIEKGNNMH